ncbi:hypothetical protein KIW84_013716 [Lathyrus oleraceus]|uniref:Retrovirus-related Pol polyprotein from transposon TNT 1-94-like beta-barrel domain-containing protein n=2 Tax=Pisum sativum TaxID=3888 RepID=A0A9D5BKY4_PEA|nr:hypothetical protein KIW84_013716 [Pisum sativum]
MKLEEHQASLEAHEMRLKRRNSEREKVAEQALQIRFIKKFGKEKAKPRNNLANDKKSSKNSKNHSNSTKKVMGNNYSGEKVDMKEFTKLDESVKKVTRFVNGRHVTSSGKGNIVVVRKDGKRVTITGILYVPSMTSNLISIGQLLAKGYKTKLEENLMKVYNGEGKMIMKAPLADKKTFKMDAG